MKFVAETVQRLELLMRWKWADIANTGVLITEETQVKFKFCTAAVWESGIGEVMEGTVIAHHKSKRCFTLSMHR